VLERILTELDKTWQQQEQADRLKDAENETCRKATSTRHEGFELRK